MAAGPGPSRPPRRQPPPLLTPPPASAAPLVTACSSRSSPPETRGFRDFISGKDPFGFFDKEHNGETFVELLDYVDALYPRGRKGHLVCDSLAAHNTDDVLDWREEHPNWTLHFTPRHASWLNQIECAFSRFAKEVLRRGSFVSPEERIVKAEDWLAKPTRPALRLDLPA